MPRFAKIGILLVAAVLGFLLVTPLVSRRPPGMLYVHIDGFAWTNVTVRSENLPQPLSFVPSNSAVQVTPVSHGIYRIGVQFADGQSVWSEFFHADAGVRRRVDVFLAPSSRPGYIHVRETINQKDLLFENDIRPADASEQKPSRLGWI
jgi:hypothetical protein